MEQRPSNPNDTFINRSILPYYIIQRRDRNDARNDAIKNDGDAKISAFMYSLYIILLYFMFYIDLPTSRFF